MSGPNVQGPAQCGHHGKCPVARLEGQVCVLSMGITTVEARGKAPILSGAGYLLPIELHPHSLGI